MLGPPCSLQRDGDTAPGHGRLTDRQGFGASSRRARSCGTVGCSNFSDVRVAESNDEGTAQAGVVPFATQV
jgi:hypothetical protein